MREMIRRWLFGIIDNDFPQSSTFDEDTPL